MSAVDDASLYDTLVQLEFDAPVKQGLLNKKRLALDFGETNQSLASRM